MASEEKKIIRCRKLADIQKDLQKPYRPSIRRRQMDDQLGKLPNETGHRTFAKPSEGLPDLGNFPKKWIYQYYPPQSTVRLFDVLPMCDKDDREKEKMLEYSLTKNPETLKKWRDFVLKLPDSLSYKPKEKEKREYRFINCDKVSVKVEEYVNHRMTMKPGPAMKNCYQFAIPSELAKRYRNV